MFIFTILGTQGKAIVWLVSLAGRIGDRGDGRELYVALRCLFSFTTSGDE